VRPVAPGADRKTFAHPNVGAASTTRLAGAREGPGKETSPPRTVGEGVGLRLDRDTGQVWALCESTGEGLASSAPAAVERAQRSEGVDDGWFDDVTIAQGR
jgi:hypothetical protein